MEGLLPKPFKFKQFNIFHHQEVMKVSTDSVLLGSWVDIEDDELILDAGCGCGILTLMAAQRNKQAKLFDTDKQEIAIETTKVNWKNSSFRNDVNFFIKDILSWSPDLLFDHILCNPPYFQKVTLPTNDNRLSYRHASHDFLEQFLAWCEKHLSSHAKLSLVLPADRNDFLTDLLSESSLRINRKLLVYHREDAPLALVLHEIIKGLDSVEYPDPKIETLVLYKEGLIRTKEYQLLCNEFYI